jgi:hypothetical protein
VRNISILTLLLWLILPGVASSQSLELFGSAGPTITDTGNSFAVGAGFSPTSRITLVFNFERTHLATQTSRDGDVVSTFRGGTLFLGTGEFRYAPFGRSRVRPYGLAGFAGGISRPNVNDRFQDRITNRVRAFFAGGGVDVPVGEQLSVFADVRMMLGAEGNDGMFGVAPLRAGVRFAF